MDLDALYVVGVGASAGGLESLERFFRSIPASAPLAFVVVQHLSASHKSLMPELIRRFTPLSVHDAEEGTKLAPGCIYVLTAGTEVEVRRDELAVMDRDSQRALAFPIDRMFSSPAPQHASRSHPPTSSTRVTRHGCSRSTTPCSRRSCLPRSS